MNETFAEIRRLMLATNRIDGAYYLLSRKLGVKENILALLYALDDEGDPFSEKEFARIGCSQRRPSIPSSGNWSKRVM